MPRVRRKLLTLTSVVLSTLSAAAIAQGPRGKGSAADAVQISGNITWLVMSDVSALTEGVINKMERKAGDQVRTKDEVGQLYARKAELTVAKAQLAADNMAAIAKGLAQRDLAIAEAARIDRLIKRGSGFASISELEKAQAEVKVGDALVQEAREQKTLYAADLDIAKQNLAEHMILAPFDGVITERLKHPGESVRSQEPVFRLGKVDTLKFHGDLLVADSYRIKKGDIVDVTPEIENDDLPIEKKRFRGKITLISQEVASLNKAVVRVEAEIQNNTALELRPGLKANMVVYLNPADAPPPAADSLPDAVPAPAARRAPQVIGTAPR